MIIHPAEKRTLTDYETAVASVLASIGFIYWPHEKGGGYYWHKELGLQLTDDLAFHARGSRRVWTLKRIDGLKLYERTFGQTKRKAESIAVEICEKLQRLMSRPGWLDGKEWYLTDLSK